MARPSPEHCGYCAARHLCSEYWDVYLGAQGQQQSDRRFGDLEVTVIGRHGPASWDAVADVSGWLPRGKALVLRTGDELSLQRRQRLRIIDAGITVDDDTLDTLAGQYRLTADRISSKSWAPAKNGHGKASAFVRRGQAKGERF